MPRNKWDAWRWKLPRISARDLVWLAGLLEGEGCFSLQCYRNGVTCLHALPSIEVQMTDRDVVARAGKLLGGGQTKVRGGGRPKAKRFHKVYIWRVNGQRAVHVMKLLLPHMGKRRSARITALVKQYETHLGPKGGYGFVKLPVSPHRR
jgi:hypothetical protein